MRFKSGLIHLTRYEILPDKRNGERSIKAHFTDGASVWLVYAQAATLGDALEAAYNRSLTDFGLPKEKLVNTEKLIEALHLRHSERLKKGARTGRIATRDIPKLNG